MTENAVKKLLPLLFALVAPSAAGAEDPIAYSCYFCSWDEMQELAVSHGAGEHYVYDTSRKYLVGFNVSAAGETPGATGFAPPGWIQTQFNAMINAYNAPAGAFVHSLRDVVLLAPGTHAARSDAYLWGHHTSALHPLHPQARETARRYIASKATQFDYLKADVEQGRLLRLQSENGATIPIVVRLEMRASYVGSVDFFYDRASGGWEYLGAKDVREPIQESAEDFAGPSGRRTYFYSQYHIGIPNYFVQRALLAGVTVVGKTPPYRDLGIACEREGAETVCTLIW